MKKKINLNMKHLAGTVYLLKKVFNEETIYKSYKKRCKEIPFFKEQYNYEKKIYLLKIINFFFFTQFFYFSNF